MSDIEQFRAIAQPPPWALKTIGGGRLKGMTDIKPAWRIQAMTEQYGLCGIGWKYEIVKQWTEPGSDGQMFAFAKVDLFVKTGDAWSSRIPGIGGNMLIEKERGGLHSNDEAFKMAVTDALSSAMKMIGCGADVYAGQWDGSKYRSNAEPPPPPVSAEHVAELTLCINGATDIPTLKKTIQGGKLYQRLKLNGPVADYVRLAALARAKHAVLKGADDNANSGGDKATDQS